MAAEDTPESESLAESDVVASSGGWRSRLLSGPRWVLQKPLVRAPLVLAVLLIPAGMIVLASYSMAPERASLGTLEDALAALDEGRLQKAKTIAMQIDETSYTAYDEQLGKEFVLGAAAALEAIVTWDPKKRKKLSLVAASYLNTVRNHAFPLGRRAQGLTLLGNSLVEIGLYARSLPVLTEALEENPVHPEQVHYLLSISYKNDSPPDLEKSLYFSELYLGGAELSPDDRNRGLLRQSEIQLLLGRRDDALATLGKIPVESSFRAEVLVMLARLKIDEYGPLLSDPRQKNEALRKQAQAEIASAEELLQRAQARDALGSSATRQSEFLAGVCRKLSGDQRAAATQFSRVRRLYFGTPECVAAGVEEGDAARALGNDTAALAAYRRAIQEAGPPKTFSNTWMTLGDMRFRLHNAYFGYIASGKFQQAIDLARAMPPLVSDDKAMELRAKARRAWADHLFTEARGKLGLQAEPLLRRAREQMRKAAIAYGLLAQMRQASTDFGDYLWESAGSYLAGRDFEHAERLLRTYLARESSGRRAQALAALGEALLSQHRVDEAIVPLADVIASFPQHPASYRARLLTAQALVEKRELENAQKILYENLHSESLTPRGPEWRDSLIALGKVLYQRTMILDAESKILAAEGGDEATKKTLRKLEELQKVAHEAVAILEEAAERYPDSDQIAFVKYYQAESVRRAAKFAIKRLPLVTIETSRAVQEREIQKELLAAVAIYSELTKMLVDQQEREPPTESQRGLLRNCYFARAEAFFDMKQYEEAIHAYSTATNLYQTQPESLEAFVQIAACLQILQRPVEARGSLEQAKLVLQRIPANADFTKTTRYGREDWSSLLDLLIAR